MAKAKNVDLVVQKLTGIRMMLEVAYAQLKSAMATLKYEDLERLRKTMIDVITEVNAVIDEIERVGDRNDGN